MFSYAYNRRLFLKNEKIKEPSKPISQGLEWTAPDTMLIPATKEGELIRYGRELILHTAHYFGTDGRIAQISNGMNCNIATSKAAPAFWEIIFQW